MATFTYHALTSAGRLMKGTLEARDREQASQVLTEMHLEVSSIEKTPEPRPRSPISRTEFLLFNQQLASLTKAGIPLAQGLRELSADVSSKRMRRAIVELSQDLEAGLGVEQAFEKHAGRFPALYGRIVRAGIESGRLSEMLSSLNRHLESANQTRRILFEALAYPCIILLLAAVIMTAVFRGLVPSFRTIYTDFGGDLPSLTRWVLGVSDNVWTFWAVGAGTIVAVALLLTGLSASVGGRRLKESFYVKIPVLGRLYHRSLLSRLADAMGLLVGAGIDMPSCLRLSAGATGSELLVSHCERIAQSVESGQPIVEAGAFARFVPGLFLYSVQLGSQRDELRDNLYCLSEMYRRQVETNQSRLQALLLPIMLVIVGGVIALVILAMFAPMANLVNQVAM